MVQNATSTEGPTGRHQYVIGNDGEPVFGVWVLTEEAEADAPVIIMAQP